MRERADGLTPPSAMAIIIPGTWSDVLRLTAIDQMRQAGVTITSGVAAFTEMLRDNASPLASEYYAALDLPATRYILQITQANNDASKQRAA
jgi:hypothetical protein